jgi:hypothetical protein
MQDIWAYCAPCDRWYACPHGFDRAAAPPRCPVCASEPQLIENREEDTGRRPDPTAAMTTGLPVDSTHDSA